MTMWNLWHGCHKKSEGCAHCYMFRSDIKHNINPESIYKTKSFNAPIQKTKKGEYKIKSGSTIWTCFSSDFFLEEADEWRDEAWSMIRDRRDCNFFFITKRPERIQACLPADWNDGYEHVGIGVTCENQKRADERLPQFMALPIKKKTYICEPMLEAVDLSRYLDETIVQVVCGGESGMEARVCNWEWVLDLKRQCDEKGVDFWFKQTGYRFVKDGKMYLVKRAHQHAQARKAQKQWLQKDDFDK